MTTTPKVVPTRLTEDEEEKKEEEKGKEEDEVISIRNYQNKNNK